MKYNIMTKDNSFWSQFCFGHLSLALPLRKQRKANTKMGEKHHRYIQYDGSSKQSGGRQASTSQTSGQRRPEEDMLSGEEVFIGNQL